MSQKYLKSITNILVFVTGIILLFVLAPKVVVFFLPFVIGWIISLIANPLVRLLERKLKIVRKHSSMLIIIVVIGLIVTGGYFAIVKIAALIADFGKALPDLYSSLMADIEEGGKNLQNFASKLPPQVGEAIADLTENFTTYLGDAIGAIGMPTVEIAGNFAKNIPNALIHIVFTILSAYFFIADKVRIVTFYRKYLPVSLREKWHFVMGKFKSAIGGYFKAQFKIMGIVAVILFGGFLVLRIRYAILFALFIAVLDFLPFLGTGTFLIPWAIIKILNNDYGFAIGLIAIYVISQVVRQVIQPKILGDTMGLDPLITLIFMFIGYKLSSIFGMIIAVPVGMIVISLYQSGAFDGIIRDFKEVTEGINQFRKGKE